MSNPTELPDLDKLEALAKAATPGPWAWASDWDRAAVYSTTHQVPRYKADPICKRVVCTGNQNNDGRFGQENWSGSDWNDAKFIAAANPAAVLALIAAVRRAQHAESGESHGLTIGEAFKAVGGWMNGGELGYPSFGSMNALLVYTQKMVRAALAAQQAAAPGARLVAPDNLPRWIDDMKGKDLTIDSLIDYSINKGDTVYTKTWSLTSLEVVDVNWALSAIAVRLGPDGGVVVWPAAGMSKTPYDQPAAPSPAKESK